MDVSHELGALRFVVDSPLSSKVAMFNQQVNQHKQAQLLNPFSGTDGRASPKPSFSKDEYGKPLAGSLTEMRGQKANMHVLKEMLELCQIIDSEGYEVKDEPSMRVIPFGELFNIYNYISDKVVGILLRARKHKLVEFEGEMLFQRRDDDVPIFLLRPIHEIRHELNDKIDSIKRSGSPAPQATSVILDKRAYGLDLPKGATPRSSVSRTPSPQSSKGGTPVREIKPKVESPLAAAPVNVVATENPKIQLSDGNEEIKKNEVVATKPVEANKTAPIAETAPQQSAAPKPTEVKEEIKPVEAVAQEQKLTGSEITIQLNEVPSTATQVKAEITEAPVAVPDNKTDVNNNNNVNELPTIVIEATAVYERPAKTEEISEAPAPAVETTTTPNASSEPSTAPLETKDSA